jgi:Zn-dependent protease with chaperone function
MNENDLNDQDASVTLINLQTRRQLLPWWVIVFIWVFLLFAAAMPVAIVMAFLHYNFQVSLLGLGTNDPFTLVGLFLIALFAFKGIVALSLWNEKQWAVKLAKVDAIISIVVCCLVMGYEIFIPHLRIFSFRLELVVIIPYYAKMRKIQYDWENIGDNVNPGPSI